MNSLPQELIHRIVFYTERYENQSYLPVLEQHSGRAGPPSQLPRLANLSRYWKEAVESVTFHHLEIKSDELDTLLSVVKGNRRKYLAKISFTVLLPEYSDEACGRVESQEEELLNDEAFSRAIRELFAILKTWEDDGVQNALNFELRDVYSPTDLRIHDRELELQVAMRKRVDIFQKRFANSYLRLLQHEHLPVLSNLQRLVIEDNIIRRNLTPRIAPDLAALLPNLKHIIWQFGDCGVESTNVQLEMEQRVAFAHALKARRLRERSTAQLTYAHGVPFDQRGTPSSIVPSDLSYDPLSAAVRVFSQNLTALTLSTHLDATLFWPSADEENAETPTWPHLETLDVKFSMVSPSGSWYFTGSQPEDDEGDDPERGIVGNAEQDSDYTNYREHADSITLDPFLAAFARAIRKMPVLEHFQLTSELGHSKGISQISYYAPGRAAQWGDEGVEDLNFRRVFYEVGSVWRPEVETLKGLRDAGKDKFDGEVIERFLESQYA